MKVFFTKHARDRMVERNITIVQIYRIIAKPDYIKGSFNGRVAMGKRLGTETIEMICVKKFDKIIVLTIYSLWK